MSSGDAEKCPWWVRLSVRPVAVFLIGVFELTVSVVRPWASFHPIIGLGLGIFTVLMAGIFTGYRLGGRGIREGGRAGKHD